MVAVWPRGVWPAPWVPSGCRGAVAGPLAPGGRRGSMAGPQRPVWPPWKRGRSPGPRLAAVGAWPLPLASSGRRPGVSGPLHLVWPLWGCGRSAGTRMAAVGCSRSPGPLLVAVGACPVQWAPSGHRVGMRGPLCTVWVPWGVASLLYPVLPTLECGRSPGPRLAAMGAWPFFWTPSGC